LKTCFTTPSLALAVLPLSNVECERGFSKQNLIKTLTCVNLSDGRLTDLMVVSLLEYPIEYMQVVEVFMMEKKRRPSREVEAGPSKRPVAAEAAEYDELV
ncbi:hypothetical protein CLOM_g23921, partial [Closterium sp. NIES-68]